jgi:hypothetical protein
MSKPTGRPRGRPKGSTNKKTEKRKAAAKKIAKKLELLLPDAFNGDAHALLMLVYKDPSLPIDLRMDAAKAAIRYETPALQATELTGANGSSLIPPALHIEFIDPPEYDDKEGE